MGDDGSFVLPTGTVAFLLTDIERSTRAWEAEPEAMAAALDLHNRILDRAVSARGGVCPPAQGEGDSIVAAFSRASDAVLAARDAQRELAAATWPTTSPVRVRMAVHAGEARFVDDLEPWENRKLWLLNGAHSILAFAGLTRGLETVAAAIDDPLCRALVTDFWAETVMHLPEGIEHVEYRRDLLETCIAYIAEHPFWGDFRFVGGRFQDRQFRSIRDRVQRLTELRSIAVQRVRLDH